MTPQSPQPSPPRPSSRTGATALGSTSPGAAGSPTAVTPLLAPAGSSAGAGATSAGSLAAVPPVGSAGGTTAAGITATGSTAPAQPGRAKCLLRLQVGMPTLSDRRIARIPIRIESVDGARADFELQFRYPQDTFAEGPAAESRLRNFFTLAALLPLLNYLPFTRELVVEGALEPEDVEWINPLALATAQEILKYRLNLENPFLRREAVEVMAREPLPVAPIRPTSSLGAGAPLPALDDLRAAVVVEGPAECLLSLALLEELQTKPLAVFYAGPGRGLGAATNAHTALEKTHPDAVAVIWTNLSMLDSFILRHLDFLRTGYETIRADISPIRVFEHLAGGFAALPVLWARNIRHLVSAHRSEPLERRPALASGLPMPNFDNTRVFDDHVSRFYTRKGWAVQQWALLRPASPITIHRTLHERYDSYYPLQVGCLHPRRVLPPGMESDPIVSATASRAVPCGACEACRRLVVILSALGRDLRELGYGPAMIERALAHTTRITTLPPEARVQRHVMHLLDMKRNVAPRFEACPEVEALRFDPQRAFVDAIPTPFRRRTYEILLAHANGAVKREGKEWKPFDLLNSAETAPPPRFREQTGVPPTSVGAHAPHAGADATPSAPATGAPHASAAAAPGSAPSTQPPGT